jgi:hypothetical protein
MAAWLKMGQEGNDMDPTKVSRLSPIIKTAGDWGTEATPIGGPELKALLDRLRGTNYEEATAVPRVFILAQGATGAIRVDDSGETYLYWQ